MRLQQAEYQPHIRSLDALRSVMALLVVIAHALQVFSFPYTGIYLGFPARAAVLFFFCLSGFVIAMSVHGNLRRNGRFDIKEYAVSRFMRIAPPFLAVVALTWLFATLLASVDAGRVDLEGAARRAFVAMPLEQVASLLSLTIFGDLTGALVNGPLWSLVFEIQLYVIAALAVMAWTRKGWVAALMLTLLIAYLCAFGITGLKLRTLSYMAFGFGSVAYVLRHMSTKALIRSLVVTTPIAALFGYKASFIPMLHMDGAWTWISFQVSLSAVFALLVLAASRFPLVFELKDYSYTLYILHFPLFLFIYFLLYHYQPRMLAHWASLLALVAVPLAIVCAAVVGQIERFRLHKLLRRKVDCSATPPTAAVGTARTPRGKT